MSDQSGPNPGHTTPKDPISDPGGGGRRQADRRQSSAGYTGPERRQGDRRTGADRRTTPREDGEG